MPITYESPEHPDSARRMLAKQANILAEMTERCGIDTAIVTQVQAAIERDATFLSTLSYDLQSLITALMGIMSEIRTSLRRLNEPQVNTLLESGKASVLTIGLIVLICIIVVIIAILIQYQLQTVFSQPVTCYALAGQ